MYYNISSDTWKVTGDISVEFLSATSSSIESSYVVCGNSIYFVTSETRIFGESLMYIYDTVNNVWDYLSLGKNLCYSTPVAYEDIIYYFGSHESPGLHSFNTQSQVLKTLNSSGTWGGKISSGLLLEENNIYSIAGRVMCGDGFPLASNKSEIYDMKNNSWTTLENLIQERESHQVVKIGNKVYALGGYDPQCGSPHSLRKDSVNARFGNGVLKSVEVYDLSDNSLSSIPDMNYARQGFTAIEIDGVIYCIGGDSNGTVEAYDTNPDPIEVVEMAEKSQSLDDIRLARAIVNSLPESTEKDQLQLRLNALIVSDLSLTIENITSNLDVYITSNNSLSLSLDNSSIIFEEFEGISDLYKSNALSFTVSSSINYNASISLVGNITSSKGNTMDKSILNLKASGDTAYKNYSSSNTLSLFANQTAGNNKTHKVDMMLNGAISYVADVYKAVLKVEVEQL